MKAKTLDRKFDRGENVAPALDLTRARRPGQELRRVNVDFPVWMIESLDQEARRVGVTRQSIIKVWIAQMLERTPQPLPSGSGGQASPGGGGASATRPSTSS
ncbi:MAG: CopG family transcriptional regulator [Candidatus Delongbacteria bacterium]